MTNKRNRHGPWLSRAKKKKSTIYRESSNDVQYLDGWTVRDNRICKESDWLILTAWKPDKAYFMPKVWGIVLIVHLYLHLWVVISEEFLAQVFPSNTNNLHTAIWYQVFQSNTNNFHTVIWFQVFLSNINNYIVSSSYSYLNMIVICFHTVIWFQETNKNKPS